jgi:hypothetical protein
MVLDSAIGPADIAQLATSRSMPTAPLMAAQFGEVLGAADRLPEQPEHPGTGDGLGAVGRAELVEDVADVLLDRVEGHH